MTSSRILRVAQLSYWFSHADHICEAANKHPQVELVGAWDSDLERGRKKAEAFEVPFYADLDRLLTRPDLDAVSICAEAFRNPELVEAAAAAGKDILIEKSMAADLDGAARIVRAVERYGVRLMPAFNLRYTPAARQVKRWVDTGEVGTIGRVRYLHGHYHYAENARFQGDRIAKALAWDAPMPSRTQSLFFVGAHTALWFVWMFGVPETVMCMTNTLCDTMPVEDHSVVLLNYGASERAGMRKGFVGVMDSSETQLISPLVSEIYGTGGVILHYRGNLPSNRVGGAHALPVGLFRQQTQTWDFPQLPAYFQRHEDRYTSPGIFFTKLLQDETIDMGARDGYDAIAILVAAEESARTGREVRVPHWPDTTVGDAQ